jgi:DNA-directed RNA polymerase III subunit RPC3
MLPSDAATSGTSMVSNVNVSSLVSQQLLFQLGASISNNVVSQPSTTSSNSRTTTSVRCHSKNDPIVSLASHIIQTLFGTIVQTVADCLQCRGFLSLREIVSYLIPNNTRTTSHSSLRASANRTTDRATSSGRNNRKGVSSSQIILTLPQIKAALLVLIQHSIITTSVKRPSAPSNNNAALGNKKNKQLSTSITVYRYHPIKAIYMNYRYAKFVEYIRKAMIGSRTASTNSSSDSSHSHRLVEELLLYGRLRTIDVIMHTIQRITNATNSTSITTETSSETANVATASQQQIQSVVDAFSKLVTSGFIVPSRVLSNNEDNDDRNTEDDMENEWSDTNEDDGHRPKRLKRNAHVDQGEDNDHDANLSALYQGDALSVALLLTNDKSYQQILPVKTLWTVNSSMFHDHLRAYFYGKYISERYGQNHFRGNTGSDGNSQSSFACIGSLITAALKYRAYRTYALTDPHGSHNHGVSHFTVADIMKYIPKSVVQMIEKKVGETGGSTTNVESSIQQILCDLCSLNYHPHFLRQINDSYHGNKGSESQQQIAFEVVLPTISNDYIDRIIYQVVHDRHGAIAARVVSILSVKGYLESDRIADIAMVPAKDTREVLHHLYRSRYVELLQLSNSSRQQYNPNNAIYLWGIERPRLIQRMIDDVAKALYNLRLRRQHEVETIGAEWLERMTTNQQHQPYSHDHTNNFTTDVENIDLNITNAIDRENYTMFCIGLERIDVASIQLDETLMALLDFPKILH